MGEANQFLSGAICMAYVVVTIFFLKFWKKTRDSLFLCFAAAFVLFTIVRISLSVISQESEARGFLYLGRGLAVLLIVVAVIQKNKGKNVGAHSPII